jgi:hypothetical protein
VKTATEKATAQKAVVEKAAAVVKVISSQILDTVCEMERIGEEIMLRRLLVSCEKDKLACQSQARTDLDRHVSVYPSGPH